MVEIILAGHLRNFDDTDHNGLKSHQALALFF